MSASTTHGLKSQQQQLATDQSNQNSKQQFDTNPRRKTANLYKKEQDLMHNYRHQ
jgi:hypothetical protein